MKSKTTFLLSNNDDCTAYCPAKSTMWRCNIGIKIPPCAVICINYDDRNSDMSVITVDAYVSVSYYSLCFNVCINIICLAPNADLLNSGCKEGKQNKIHETLWKQCVSYVSCIFGQQYETWNFHVICNYLNWFNVLTVSFTTFIYYLISISHRNVGLPVMLL